MDSERMAGLLEDAAQVIEGGGTAFMCMALDDVTETEKEHKKALRILARHLGEKLGLGSSRNLPQVINPETYRRSSPGIRARIEFLRDLSEFYRDPARYRKEKAKEWNSMMTDTQLKQRLKRSVRGKQETAPASSIACKECGGTGTASSQPRKHMTASGRSAQADGRGMKISSVL